MTNDSLSSQSSHEAPSGSYVYFIGAVGGPIKIGRALDPKARRRDLQVGSDRQLLLLATIPGGREMEKTLHRRFAASHVRGEYYLASPDLLMLVWEAAAGRAPPNITLPPPSRLEQFLIEEVEHVRGARLRSSILYAAFERWAAANGVHSYSQTAFSMGLAAAGFRRVTSNGVHWLGIRLRGEMVR